MPSRVGELLVNEETPLEYLEHCLLEAAYLHNSTTNRAAAQAKAEIERRQLKRKIDDYERDKRDRINAQKFQRELVDRQLELVEKQLEGGANQLRVAMHAKWAAVACAIAIGTLAAIDLAGLVIDSVNVTN